MKLFSSEKTVFKLPNAEVIYIPNFYSINVADQYFKHLKTSIHWQQDDITLYGKTYKQPRLTALYAQNTVPYTYSNINMTPHSLTSQLTSIKNDIEMIANHNFTTVLLNLYRNGNDSNGWHADNEKELGKNPVIASVSFGAPRIFHFKHTFYKDEKYRLVLEHGSLLLMHGEMQHFWLHQLPKTKKQIGERINLTYRTMKPI